MDINKFYKAVLDADTAPIVLCDLNHTIVYMNDSAINRYGKQILGQSLLKCHNEKTATVINEIVDLFKKDINNNIVYESRNDEENKDVYIVALRDEDKTLIGYYEKHEYRTNETIDFYKIKK